MHSGAASLSCGSALHAERPTCQQGVLSYCTQTWRLLRRNINVCLCCRLLEPGEESLPLWMSDASPELCGHLRLSAAGALLRLARRHDTRISPSIYCALALMMQDEVEGVRAAFAAKVHRLIRHFQVRGAWHAVRRCLVVKGLGGQM